MNDYLSSADTAKRLGITAATLAGWRCHGKGPRYHKIGRGVFYKPADVEKWLEGCAVDPATKHAA